MTQRSLTCGLDHDFDILKNSQFGFCCRGGYSFIQKHFMFFVTVTVAIKADVIKTLSYL